MNILLDNVKKDLEANINKRDCQYVDIGGLYGLSKQALDKGICIILPVRTDFGPVTTGIKVQDIKSFKIIFAKSTQNLLNTNAQRENSSEWQMRVMENRNPDGTLKTNSGIYIVISNLRKWGILQGRVSINYDTRNIQAIPGGVTEGTIIIEQKDIYNVTIN